MLWHSFNCIPFTEEVALLWWVAVAVQQLDIVVYKVEEKLVEPSNRVLVECNTGAWVVVHTFPHKAEERRVAELNLGRTLMGKLEGVALW